MLANRIMMAAAGRSVATVTFAGSSVSGSNLTTYAFSAHAIGAAAANRKVVVAAATAGGSGADGVSTVTVGGISATLVKATLTTDHTQVEIWQADVPTGTTADIVVTWNAGKGRCGIGVWAVYGAAGAASDTVSVTGTGALSTTALAIPANGVAIGGVVLSGTGLRTTTWAGLTENFDEEIEAATNLLQTGASLAVVAAQSAPTISATFSGAINWAAMSLASWAPA